MPAQAEQIFRDGMELRLQLEGQVFDDAPIAGAEVRLIDGNSEIVTQTDVNGRFRLRSGDIVDRSRVPLLVARGSGNDSHIEFRSYPGSYGQLLDLVGQDGTLDEVERPDLRLSAFTTAYAALADNLIPNGPRTAGELARTSSSYLAHDASALLLSGQLLAEALLPLPDGAQTVWQALVSPALANSVAAASSQLDGAVVDAARNRVEAAQLIGINTIPVGRWLIPFQGQAINFFSGLGGLRFEGDGTASFRNDSLNVAGAWNVVDGQAVLTPDAAGGALISEGFTRREISPGQFANVRFQQYALDFRLRLRHGPAGTRLGVLSSNRELRFPDNPQLAPEVSLTLLTDWQGWSLSDGSAPAPFPIENVAGSVLVFPACLAAGCVPDAASLSAVAFFQEPHSFRSDGSGDAVRMQRPFTWQLDNGRLQITYADGATARVTQVSAEAPGVLGAATVDYTTGAGAPRLLVKNLIRQQGSADPLAGIAPGRFRYSYGAISSYRVAQTDSAGSFTTYRLAADGSGDSTASNNTVRPVEWTTPAADKIRLDRLVGTQRNPRFAWQVLNRIGDMVVVLEAVNIASLPNVDAAVPSTTDPTQRLFAFRLVPSP